MMLAFFIDQVQQMACHFFKKARVKMGTKVQLWESMRVLFLFFKFEDWKSFLQAVAGSGRMPNQFQMNSS